MSGGGHTEADRAWAELLAATGRMPPPNGQQRPPLLEIDRLEGLRIRGDAPTPCRDLLSLYLPLCAPDPEDAWVIGHLGQSLNGCIATDAGESCFVTGRENIAHLHRLRALCDAILVGAGTVAQDDPRLTTRLVAGPNPVRVVLDAGRRLGTNYRVFQDGEARSLLCTASPSGADQHGLAEVLRLPSAGGELELGSVVRRLAERGLRRLFVEGGGVTVSRFLDAGLLTRLHVAVAPVIIGQGRCGLALPKTERLADAPRVPPRLFRMGMDVLYDLDLTASPQTDPPVGLVQML
jgi:diaminohydroxyphosphoribosylaminopyrimidine deaminase/5-amino-6-(5-phosphoribosylamino)uracil reductase